MSELLLSRLVKSYRNGPEDIRVINDVSLRIAPGELVALYGPSGSGKSTLLQLAAGLLAPDSGSASFAGRDISQLRSLASAEYRRHDVGIVFQSFHLLSGASSLENAAMKLLADGHALREAKSQAQPWLNRVGLGPRAAHKVSRLSMGERQRVAIARALVNEPKLLLADEPTGNLDSKRSREVLQLLREICDERQIPVLLVTHDPQASPYATHLYTLKDGALHEGLDPEIATVRTR